MIFLEIIQSDKHIITKYWMEYLQNIKLHGLVWELKSHFEKFFFFHLYALFIIIQLTSTSKANMVEINEENENTMWWHFQLIKKVKRLQKEKNFYKTLYFDLFACKIFSFCVYSTHIEFYQIYFENEFNCFVAKEIVE